MRASHASLVTGVMAFLAVTLLGGEWLGAQDAPPATPAQEQPEVLSRGPVHEAFAAPVDLQLEEGMVTPSQPPAIIEEVPPAEKPQGQQFVWIPGYWSLDADRSGYIWVSACWRVAPPKMSWVPGYWSQAPGGWKWVSGFWTPAGAQEFVYLPAPPAVADVEPRDAAPSADTIWVPPCMYWVQGQYTRRDGYWLAAQPDWIWAPSHYVWTPRGYVFADGHWDYALERRGVLFAPVYFPASVYGRSGYTYSPSVVLDIGLLQVSLFAYPRYSHYYFGDYYDDAYLRVGIYPWFDSRRLHTWYDPIYEHDRWQHHRTEPRWEARERDTYRRSRDDKSLRPARTYREQEARLAKLPEPQRRAHQVAQPIAVAAANRETPLKFERINTGERQKIVKQATASHEFSEDRSHWEAKAASPRTVVEPIKEHKATVTPDERHQETVTPKKERKSDVTPSVERKEPAPPAVTREPVVAPPSETRTIEPERVRLPARPIVDRSEVPDVIQKGPPNRPSGEDRGREARDSRDADKDMRKDKDSRHND
ncbi:MAG: hypothetical protein WCR06_01325 [bacterium]